MHYKKVKRKEQDFCNICGKQAKLTWDHVPPKCCNNQYSIKANSWVSGLPEETHYEKNFQNGIRYRSLCEECNNKLLGANYDVVLAEFTNQITEIMRSSLELPPIVKVPVKINRLCRAICGHILAAKNFFDDICIIDQKLRDYVLDMEALPPTGMSLLYWIYPYSTIMIMRDIGVFSFSENFSFPKGTVSIMNSFPAAYVISTDKERCGLFDLFSVCSTNIDEVIYVPVEKSSCYFPNSNQLRHFSWPCNIAENDDGAAFILGNEDCMNDSKIAKHSVENLRKIRNRVVR